MLFYCIVAGYHTESKDRGDVELFEITHENRDFISLEIFDNVRTIIMRNIRAVIKFEI